MATTVTYKNNTLVTVNNQTKTLKTAGKFLEDDITLVDISGGTAAISVVDTADAAGGNVRTITALDISDTTAVAGDVASGKYFYTAAGVKTVGTASGGSGATQHTIHLEFGDSTDADIEVDYDDSLIGTMITTYTPNNWTYNNKTITLAQLDGTTWYNPFNIPIGVELIDFTSITNDTSINTGTGEPQYAQWYGITDYTPIDPSMTFSFKCVYWGSITFFDRNKNYLTYATPYGSNWATQDQNDTNVGIGTLDSSIIPQNAAYLILPTWNDEQQQNGTTSLIRTA